MVKRRRLETPSAEELNKYEEEFRRETAPRPNPGAAPIAQVSAAAARAMEMGDPGQRAEGARDKAEAGKFRDAEARGLLIVEIPIEDIAAGSLVRDRVVLDKGELEELKTSIAASGLRLPI